MAGHIAVGVDGSDESSGAVDWAADEAALRQVELRLVNASLWQAHGIVAVQPTREERNTLAQGLLDSMAERVRARRPEVTTTREEVEDAPTTVLLGAAAEAELLVVGSQGLSGGTGFLVGSVGQEVVAQATGPVALVRTGAAAGRPEGRVVLGLDVRHFADELLDFAFDFAARRRAPLRIVHTWYLPALHREASGGDDEREAEQGRDALSTVVRPYRDRFPHVQVEEQALAGRAGRHLVEAAAGAGTVVVGRRSRSATLGPHIGSVTHAVIHHAPCPVVVVPHA
ncbi:universal stress protein [Streptomyces sp. NPDC006879]|uniref:universal stress protein n=1 Tax=Streptomyces sp. NPDC006879 TaxID=3364767 RepID=UPI00367FD28F